MKISGSDFAHGKKIRYFEFLNFDVFEFSNLYNIDIVNFIRIQVFFVILFRHFEFWNFVIQDGGMKIQRWADFYENSYLNFLLSLDREITSSFQNSKWRFQYGGRKNFIFWNLLFEFWNFDDMFGLSNPKAFECQIL